MAEPKNQYDIVIKFEVKGTAKTLLNSLIPYLGSSSLTDKLDITSKEITLTAKRSSSVNLDDIFYNYNSSLYNQILKSLTYFYALDFSCPPISEITITRKRQSENLKAKTLIKSQLLQPIARKITATKVKFDAKKIEIIFQESEKGKALLVALSYWIKAMSSDDPIFTFERLWRGLNRIYTFIGQSTNDQECRVKLRQLTIDNPNILTFSSPAVQQLNENKLRQSFRWRGMILNDYATLKTTKMYKEFILRYSDYRVIKLLNETLVYRQDFLQREGFLESVKSHLNNHLKKPKNSDAELISLLCIKYMYFVRNKSFHGEKIDGTFRLIENKETNEIKLLNLVLSSFLADLINACDLY